ncbi:hypothetical protein GCM10028867_07210 [Nocardioides pacificus]
MGSLVFVLGGFEEELEEFGGASQPAERLGAEQVAASVGVAGGEDVGDAVHGGVDPGGVAGGDPGDHVAQAGGVGAGQGHVAPCLFGRDPFGVRGGVGLDDLGRADRQHPRGRLGGHTGRDRGIDQTHDRVRELAGQGRDLAHQPLLHGPGGEPGPGQRQAVAQVEDVGGDLARRQRVALAGYRELTQGELTHPRGALAPDLDQPVPTHTCAPGP